MGQFTNPGSPGVSGKGFFGPSGAAQPTPTPRWATLPILRGGLIANETFTDFASTFGAVVGSQGALVTSRGRTAFTADGIQFILSFNPVGTITFFQQCISSPNSGVIVAIGTDGVNSQLATSSDGGQTWVMSTPAGAGSGIGTGGVFFSTLQQLFFTFDPQVDLNRVWSSPDGLVWTATTQPVASTNAVGALVRSASTNLLAERAQSWLPGSDVAANQAAILTSLDGEHWTVQFSVAAPGFELLADAFTTMLATVQTAAPSVDAYTSPDGLTWTIASSSGNNDLTPPYRDNMIPAQGQGALGFQFFNGFQAGGGGDQVSFATTQDGVTWTPITPVNPGYTQSLGFAFGTDPTFGADPNSRVFVFGVGNPSASLSSLDGITFAPDRWRPGLYPPPGGVTPTPARLPGHIASIRTNASTNTTYALGQGVDTQGAVWAWVSN